MLTKGHKDPTAYKAIHKVGVMREAEIERQDELRYKPPKFSEWSEAEEQEAVIKWAEMNWRKYPALFRLFHIPNGGSRHPAEAAHLKRMGVRAGVPDLFLPYPVGDFHGLWIELKADKGRVMGSQREWIEYLRSQGYAAYVCRGAEQAINCIQLYLSNYKYTVRNDDEA